MSDKPRVVLADRIIAEANKLRIAAFEDKRDAFDDCILSIQYLLYDAPYIDSKTMVEVTSFADTERKFTKDDVCKAFDVDPALVPDRSYARVLEGGNAAAMSGYIQGSLSINGKRICCGANLDAPHAINCPYNYEMQLLVRSGRICDECLAPVNPEGACECRAAELNADQVSFTLSGEEFPPVLVAALHGVTQPACNVCHVPINLFGGCDCFPPAQTC
jgi:hypothetical protein